MFYIRWETPSQKPRAWKLRNWKWSWYMIVYRCKPARVQLFSCAHSIVKLRAMVIHVCVYARRLTIHIHFTQAQPCRNYRYMPRLWSYTELRNGKKRGIDQSETSSHLTHLIYVKYFTDTQTSKTHTWVHEKQNLVSILLVPCMNKSTKDKHNFKYIYLSMSMYKKNNVHILF